MKISFETLYQKLSMQDFCEKRYGKVWWPGPSERYRIEMILRLAGSGNKVLDIGCGDGTISKLVADVGNDVYGIDISETAVRLAQAKGIKAIKIDLGSEGRIPFNDGFFDVVILAEIIEHFFDTDYFLEKIRRVLKRGGFLILTTPNLASLGRRVLLLFGKNPLTEVRIEEVSAGHVRYFTKETLFKLLNANSFRVVSFCSDVVNLNNSGTMYSRILAKLMPTWGKTLIVKARYEE